MFAELVVEGGAAVEPQAETASEVEIVVGDVVIHAGAGAGEAQLKRAIRAALAAMS